MTCIDTNNNKPCKAFLIFFNAHKTQHKDCLNNPHSPMMNPLVGSITKGTFGLMGTGTNLLLKAL